MDFNLEDFKRKFPSLYKELREGREKMPEINPVEGNADQRSSNEYAPDVISYIRRARTNDEAIEIVNYMTKRGEISRERAESLSNQIELRGVRSFGALKTWGHYERELGRKIKERPQPEKGRDEESE